MGLCVMSSLPRWVARGQGSFLSNGEPQLQHLGHFRVYLGTWDTPEHIWAFGTGMLPAATCGVVCRGLFFVLVLLDYDLKPL